jgi:hypothetical protein
MAILVALFTLSLNDLQAKSHDKKAPVLIMGNVFGQSRLSTTIGRLTVPYS